MEENDNEEKFIVKITFYEENIEIGINSNYNLFLKNICDMFNISTEQINSISLNYIDEEGDSIILNTEEDYTIFFEQVKEKVVNNLIIKINEKEIEPNKSLESSLNYKLQKEKENKSLKNSYNIINSNNNIKNDMNNFNNNFYNSNNKDNNINNNIINYNKYEDNIKNNNINNNNHMDNDIKNINNNIDNNDLNNIIYNDHFINNNINNIYDKNKIINDFNKYEDIIHKNENEIPSEDLPVYNYKCSSCLSFPIINKMYYCNRCNIYFCDECQKIINHTHPLIIIETKNQLVQFEKEQKEKIQKRIKEINNKNNDENYDEFYKNNNKYNYNNIEEDYDYYNDFPENNLPPFEDNYYPRIGKVHLPIQEIEDVADNLINRCLYYLDEYE